MTPPPGGRSTAESLTTEASHGAVGVAVAVAALADVARLQLHRGLDVPHRLLAGLQVEAGEQGHAARPGGVLHPLGPS